MSETTYLEESGVTVTNARYMFTVGKNVQTHAMSGITSISQTADYLGWVIAGFFGFVGLMSLFGSVFAGLFFFIISFFKTKTLGDYYFCFWSFKRFC